MSESLLAVTLTVEVFVKVSIPPELEVIRIMVTTCDRTKSKASGYFQTQAVEALGHLRKKRNVDFRHQLTACNAITGVIWITYLFINLQIHTLENTQLKCRLEQSLYIGFHFLLQYRNCI